MGYDPFRRDAPPVELPDPLDFGRRETGQVAVYLLDGCSSNSGPRNYAELRNYFLETQDFASLLGWNGVRLRSFLGFLFCFQFYLALPDEKGSCA